jgi:hypothetical protein
MALASASTGAFKGVEIDRNLFTPQLVAAVKDLFAKAGRTGEKTSIWEEIVSLCKEGSVAWTAQVAPDRVGVHQSNRSTFGVGGADAQHLGDKILSVGFSWAKCGDCTAIQSPPPPHDAEIVEYNKLLEAFSDGLIPQGKPFQAYSVGGGHTNVFLRQVKAGVRSLIPERADATGHLSAEGLSVSRPAFKSALEKGLVFTIFHWQAPIVWEQLPDFAQSSLNVIVAGDQSEIEVMLKIHMMITSAAAQSDGPVDMKAIDQAACKS